MAALPVKIWLILVGASSVTAKQPSINGVRLGFVPSRWRSTTLLDMVKGGAYFRSEMSQIEPTQKAGGVSSNTLCQRMRFDLRNSVGEHEEKDYIIDAVKAVTTVNQSNDETMRQSCFHRRQFIAASAALATQLSLATPTDALDTKNLPILTEKSNYQQSPINKRSGITLSEPERIFPLSFITYLSRFLLVFDEKCQQWWYTQAQAIPAKSAKEDVERIRLRQFGQFAASVEVGLMDFERKDGVSILIDSLVRRYGPSSLNLSDDEMKDLSSSTKVTDREIRKSKEALRQIALLFSLLKEYQPVDYITQILAAGKFVIMLCGI